MYLNEAVCFQRCWASRLAHYVEYITFIEHINCLYWGSILNPFPILKCCCFPLERKACFEASVAILTDFLLSEGTKRKKAMHFAERGFFAERQPWWVLSSEPLKGRHFQDVLLDGKPLTTKVAISLIFQQMHLCGFLLLNQHPLSLCLVCLKSLLLYCYQ